MKKFLKVGLIILTLSSLVAMPIKAAKYDKKKPSDLYSKAIEHLDKNQYGKAQKVLRIYTRKKKDDADGWTLLAFSSRKLGSYANAEKYYEKALDLDPENKAALEYQGELRSSENKALCRTRIPGRELLYVSYELFIE